MMMQQVYHECDRAQMMIMAAQDRADMIAASARVISPQLLEHKRTFRGMNDGMLIQHSMQQAQNNHYLYQYSVLIESFRDGDELITALSFYILDNLNQDDQLKAIVSIARVTDGQQLITSLCLIMNRLVSERSKLVAYLIMERFLNVKEIIRFFPNLAEKLSMKSLLSAIRGTFSLLNDRQILSLAPALFHKIMLSSTDLFLDLSILVHNLIWLVSAFDVFDWMFEMWQTLPPQNKMKVVLIGIRVIFFNSKNGGQILKTYHYLLANFRKQTCCEVFSELLKNSEKQFWFFNVISQMMEPLKNQMNKIIADFWVSQEAAHLNTLIDTLPLLLQFIPTLTLRSLMRRIFISISTSEGIDAFQQMFNNECIMRGLLIEIKKKDPADNHLWLFDGNGQELAINEKNIKYNPAHLAAQQQLAAQQAAQQQLAAQQAAQQQLAAQQAAQQQLAAQQAAQDNSDQDKDEDLTQNVPQNENPHA